MATEMPSMKSQAKAFLGITVGTVIVAALVTLTSAVSLPPSQPYNEALQYVRSQHIKKVIFDVDCGVDDAIGILVALTNCRVGAPEIVAITTTHGNTGLNNVTINVLKTLRAAGRKVPVYKGSSHSLLVTPSGDNFYGQDGFGDVPDLTPPTLDEAESEHAAVALARLAREHPGEITVISLGPLTNLALAQRLDFNFKQNLHQIYWMGGSVQGIGNIKPGIEFNAFMDPEANYIIFNATGKPIITVAWETCLYHGTVSKYWRENVLGKIESPLIDFINSIERISLAKKKVWTACDAQATAVLLDPNIAKKAAMHNVALVYQGDARGALMVDYKDSIKADKNIIIVQEIDTDKFKKLLLENLSMKMSIVQDRTVDK